MTPVGFGAGGGCLAQGWVIANHNTLWNAVCLSLPGMLASGAEVFISRLFFCKIHFRARFHCSQKHILVQYIPDISQYMYAFIWLFFPLKSGGCPMARPERRDVECPLWFLNPWKKKLSSFRIVLSEQNYRRSDEVSVAGCTGCCYNDNFQCGRWW